MTAAERLLSLAGTTGTAAALLLAIGVGTTAGEVLDDYSSITVGSAAEHLLATPAENALNVPAGLFRPIRAVEAPEVKGRVRVRVALKFPQAVQILRIAASGHPVRGTAKTKWGVTLPLLGTFTPPVVAKSSARLSLKFPRCAAATQFVRAHTYVTNGRGRAACGAVAPLVSKYSPAYGWADVPETVQNPTEEMILALWS